MESVLTMPPDLIAEDRPGQWRLRNYLIYLVSAMALAGCAPTALSLAVDGAYTASEERTLDDVVDDNGIKLELNKLLLEDGLGLFKDVGTVVYRAAPVQIAHQGEHARILHQVARARHASGEHDHRQRGRIHRVEVRIGSQRDPVRARDRARL